MCAAPTQVSAYSGMADRPAVDEEEPFPSNPADGNVIIALLELSGLSYLNRANDSSLRRVNVSPLGRLPRMGRKPTSTDVDFRPNDDDNDDDDAAARTPAMVVVWQLQNNTAVDSETTPTYLRSSPMLEESMDDEGNVFSWSCVWPDESVIHTFLPMDGGNKSDCNISLGVGLQLPGMSEIQPLGVATVTIPESIQTESSFSMSVNVTKLKTRKFGGRIGKVKDSDYSVSPCTMLKIKVNAKESTLKIKVNAKENTGTFADMLYNETDASNESALIPIENHRELDPVATDATLAVSEESNIPLALLMWGSQCQDDEESSCPGAGRLAITKMKYDVLAKENTTTALSPSTSEKDTNSFVAVQTDALATQPLAILMWGSQCQDEDHLRKVTEQSDGTGLDNPHSSSISPELSQENICLAYALMEEIEMEQEKYHEQLGIDFIEPGYENQKRPVHVKRSTEQDSQLPDFLKILMRKMSFCRRQVEEAIDSVACGDLFDELIGEDVDNSLKKTRDLWHCSKNYLAQIYDLSKTGSFGSTQCSDEGSDISFSSQSTEAERKTERLIALLRRGSAKRSEPNRHRVEYTQVERRFIRLPLMSKQMKSGYRFNRNVSVCSV